MNVAEMSTSSSLQSQVQYGRFIDMKPRNAKGQFIKSGGYKLTEEHKRKVALSHIGIGKGIPLSKAHRKTISEAMKKKGIHKNEKNPAWKGNKVKYMGLHNWVRRHLGTPSKCEHCSKSFKSKSIHWANMSGLYIRDLNDWIRLCVKCHKAYDLKRAK